MSQTQPKPFTPVQERVGNVFIKWMSKVNTVMYRASGGRLGGRFAGAPVCLLTVKGRKSGRRLTVPLLYLRQGSDVVVVASKGGMSKHPLWYLNLSANPDVELEIDNDKGSYRARRASDEEKERVWPRLVEMYADFDLYQARTERNIPVLLLTPV